MGHNKATNTTTNTNNINHKAGVSDGGSAPCLPEEAQSIDSSKHTYNKLNHDSDKNDSNNSNNDDNS